MVLRPVKFNSTGNPWAGKTNESGLYNVLPVNYIVAVSQVFYNVDTPTNLGQNQDVKVLILKPYTIPLS